jgi:hypothetical protein
VSCAALGAPPITGPSEPSSTEENPQPHGLLLSPAVVRGFCVLRVSPNAEPKGAMRDGFISYSSRSMPARVARHRLF